MRAASHVDARAPPAFVPVPWNPGLLKAARPRRCHPAGETPQPPHPPPPRAIGYMTEQHALARKRKRGGFPLRINCLYTPAKIFNFISFLFFPLSIFSFPSLFFLGQKHRNGTVYPCFFYPTNKKKENLRFIPFSIRETDHRGV